MLRHRNEPFHRPYGGAALRAGFKRPRELTLAAYDTAAAERRANAASLSAADAGGALALVPFVPSPVGNEPIDAVPLAAVAPNGAPGRAEPPWLRTDLFPSLGLRFDLPAYFIDEKTVTATDVDPHQNRLRLPSDGVMRNLRPLLSTPEREASNLLHDDAPRPRQPKPPKVPGSGPEETGPRKKRKGKKHGGLPVLAVELYAGVRELQLSRWDSSSGTIVKGEGYMEFINKCGFTVGDVVEIWAFKETSFRLFGVDICHETRFVYFDHQERPDVKSCSLEETEEATTSRLTSSSSLS